MKTENITDEMLADALLEPGVIPRLADTVLFLEAIVKAGEIDGDRLVEIADDADIEIVYRCDMHDEGGADESRAIDDPDDAEDEVEDWVSSGDWGCDGACVPVYYQVVAVVAGIDIPIGEEKYDTIDVAPDHESLIRAAGGDPDCDHDWTGEGEGGLDENPGVWSTGGTTLVFHRHCIKCGLWREETRLGSQRNPGESDSVRYEQRDIKLDD